ncbi:MAG: hypothetical protein AB7I08_14595 [Thermoleophilia bacterium]
MGAPDGAGGGKDGRGGGGGPPCVPPSEPRSQRPSRNHRRMVASEGSTPSPGVACSLTLRMTAAGRSPAANAASASTRSAGHE